MTPEQVREEFEKGKTFNGHPISMIRTIDGYSIPHFNYAYSNFVAGVNYSLSTLPRFTEEELGAMVDHELRSYGINVFTREDMISDIIKGLIAKLPHIVKGA